MALDARHRSSLYLKFVPLIGEDDANALMSEFPASEADELVTKQFLRAELASLRGEFRSELAGLGAERRGEFAGLRDEFGGLRGAFGGLRDEFADLRVEFAGLRGEFADLRAELRGEIGSLRTEMAALENRLTLRLGAAIGVATAILATLITVQ